MAKTIVIVGTLDTKGEEIKYIKELIEKRGHRTIMIDGGLLGRPSFQPDITREEVASAAGTRVEDILALRNEGKAIGIMGNGAAQIVQRLFSEDRLDGIISIGGSMGTTLGTTAMKELPLWLPKLMVSVAGFSQFFDPKLVSKDLTLMPTVVDLWGCDEITRAILENAAGAIAGMVETREKRGISEKPVIGMTTMGTASLRYALWAKPLLEQKGYNVAVFTGYGTAFEEFAERGFFAGTLDFTACFELLNRIAGGISTAGPNRFEALKKMDIVQVFAPALAEAIIWTGTFESIPPKFEGRTTRYHNIFAGGIKASKEEMIAAAESMAEELSEMIGTTAMLLPTRGFSEHDRPGEPFYDPEGREAFIEAFKRSAGARVHVVDFDLHINDPEFAEQAVAILDDMIKGRIEAPGTSG